MHRRRAGQLVVVTVVVAAVGCTAAPATSPTVVRRVGTDIGGEEVTHGSRSDYRYRWERDGTDASAEPAESTPLRWLREWDAARAAAYADGSVRALRSLYTPGSVAGAADVETLREYAARGFRVVGMEMQLLRVRVVDRQPGEWRLRVTDRLHGAVAVSADGRLPLPRDRASTRELRLVRGADGRWLVADVRAARPTASDREPP